MATRPKVNALPEHIKREHAEALEGLNNSLHGLLWNKNMEVVAHTAAATHASVVLRHDFDGSDRGYPFALRVDVRYTLDAAGFRVTTTATNRDAGGWPLPFYNGWHPYFLVSDVSQARIVLDRGSGSAWKHVDVGVNNVPPRYSDMVPTTHVSPWPKNTGADPIGGNRSAPTYMDDEVKAMRTGPAQAVLKAEPMEPR